MTQYSGQQQFRKKADAPPMTFTVEVYENGALVKHELVRSIGVLADLGASKRKPLRERTFHIVEQETISKLMEEIEPRVTFSVENTLEPGGKPVPINLVFRSMEDFEPIGIIRQVDPLQQLFTLRQGLMELRTKMDGNAALYDILTDVMFNPELMEKIESELAKDLSLMQSDSSAINSGKTEDKEDEQHV